MAATPKGKKPEPHKSPPAMPAATKKAAGVAASGRKATTKAAKPRARDAGALKRAICEKIAEGTPLREICRQPGMPAWRTVYDWVGADEDFAAAIAHAREMGYEAIAEETVEMVDSEPERGPDGKVDPGWVAHTKLRVEHRLKLLAKWSPKKYGDKVTQEHTGPNGGPAQFSLTVGYMHAQRREDDDEA